MKKFVESTVIFAEKNKRKNLITLYFSKIFDNYFCSAQ